MHTHGSPQAQKGNPKNAKLVEAWYRLQDALKETEDGEQLQQQQQQLQQQQSQQNNAAVSQQMRQAGRKRQQSAKSSIIGGNSRNIQSASQVGLSMSRPYSAAAPVVEQLQQQAIGAQFVSKVSSMRSLLNLRAAARPHTRPATANIHTGNSDLAQLSVLPAEEMEELIQRTEKIHSLSVDQVLDLFTAKCADSRVEYRPEQAVVFVERIKRSCRHGSFILRDCALGLESANVLAHIFQENTHFSRLILEKNLLSNSGIALLGEALRYNETLVHLDLSSNDIGQDGFAAFFEALLDNRTLISVDVASREGLYRNKLGDRGAHALEDYLRYSHTLMFLNLSGNALSEVQLASVLSGVQNSKSLLSLNLANNELRSDSCEQLVSKLADTPLTELVLTSNRIGDAGAAQFVPLLSSAQKQYRLQRLDLSDNLISTIGASKIFEAMHKNSVLVELCLDDNKLSGKSIEAIAPFLSENLTLKTLSMQRCRLEPFAGDWLGLGLARNKVLTTLLLACNRLKNYGAKEIAEGLKHNASLQILDLEKCQIEDEGGMALAEALKNNSALENINLRENNLHDYSGAMLAEALRANSHRRLLRLNIDRNAVSYKFTEELTKLLAQNGVARKRAAVPEQLAKVEDLRVFETQKYDLDEHREALHRRALTAQTDYTRQQELFRNTQAHEQELTRNLEATYDQAKAQAKIFEQQVDHEINVLDQQTRQRDYEITRIEREEGPLHAEALKLRQEIVRVRTSLQTNQVRWREGLISFDKFLKEQTSKAKTAVSEYESTLRQIERLRKTIETGETEQDQVHEINKTDGAGQTQAAGQQDPAKNKNNQKKSSAKGKGKAKAQQQQKNSGEKKAVQKKALNK